MQLGFYFDQQRCTGCHTCVVACKQWHDVPAGPVAWRRVRTIEGGQCPNVWAAHLSLSCNHCLEPACLAACPTGAIRKRAEDGIVVVDPGLCSGCRACAEACPYGSPQFREGQSTMEKCDLCLDRLLKGERPICVVSCPLRALEAGDLQTLKAKYPGVTEAFGIAGSVHTRPALLIRPRIVNGASVEGAAASHRGTNLKGG